MLVTSVPVRSLTTRLSVPPRALTSIRSTSSSVHRDVAEVAEQSHPLPVGGDVDVLVAVAAVEQHRVGARLALDHVAAVARIPLHRVATGSQHRVIVALVAVDEVVVVAAEQDVGAVTADDRVVARTSVDGDTDECGQVPRRREAVNATVGVDDESFGGADVNGERRRGDAVEADTCAVGRRRELLGAITTVDLDGVASLTALVEVGVVAGVPHHPVVAAVGEGLIISVASSDRVVVAATEEAVEAAATQQRVVTGLADDPVATGTAGEDIVAATTEQVGRRQRTVGLVERDRVITAAHR